MTDGRTRLLFASLAAAAALLGGAAALACTPVDDQGRECVSPSQGRVVAVEQSEVREQTFVNRCATNVIVSYQWAGDFQSSRTIPATGTATLRCNAARCTGELEWGAVCDGQTQPGKRAKLSVTGAPVAPAPEAADTEEADAEAEEAPAPEDESAAEAPAADEAPAEEAAAATPAPEPEPAPQPEAEPETPAAAPAPEPAAPQTAALEIPEAPTVSGLTAEEADKRLIGTWTLDGVIDLPCEVQESKGTITVARRSAPFVYRGQAKVTTTVTVKDHCRLMQGRQPQWTYDSDVTLALRDGTVAITWHKVTPENPGGVSIYTLREDGLASQGERPDAGSYQAMMTRR